MARGPGLSLTIDRMAFPGAAALYQDFRLEVAPGETVALIGPSGIGKTTLLRLLAGIGPEFRGHVRIDGVPADQAPVPGMVFQDARLLPWLDAAGNLRAVNPTLDEADVEAALARVGLAGQARAWPRQLSGGMQRRLGLARALAVNPALFLLDEPFVSLDRAVVRELQALIAGLVAERGATAVLVSHDPEDAAVLAHRVLRLGGRPVRILADLGLPGTPGQRNRGEIAALVDQIEATAVEAVP